MHGIEIKPQGCPALRQWGLSGLLCPHILQPPAGSHPLGEGITFPAFLGGIHYPRQSSREESSRSQERSATVCLCTSQAPASPLRRPPPMRFTPRGHSCFRILTPREPWGNVPGKGCRAGPKVIPETHPLPPPPLTLNSPAPW